MLHSKNAQFVHQKLAIFCSLLLTLGATTLSGQQIELELNVSSTTYSPGETFVADLVLLNSAGLSVRGLQHAISWDSEYLQLLNVELTGDLEGSPVPEILIWNAPPPAGLGGDQGCSSWWDGTGLEALSLGLILTESISADAVPLVRMEFRVVGSSNNGTTQISTPDPDLSCGWIGSIATDSQGMVLPTSTSVVDLSVSNLLRPTDLNCGEVDQTVYLSWLEPVAYSQIEIHRDGNFIAQLPGGVLSFEDPDGVLGTERAYRIIGISGSLESPEVNCIATIDGDLETPSTFSCEQNGATVLLTWENLLPYDQVEVLRQGEVLSVLDATANSFIDQNPIPGTTLQYSLRSTLSGISAESEVCELFLPIPDVLFIRGDVDSDGELNLVDPVTTLQYLFVFGDMPCASAADFNDDGSLDLSDAVNLLDFLFTGGGAPEAPFPLAGLDPTPDSLGCDAGCDDVTCGSGFPGDECISALTVTIGGNEFDTSLMTDSSDAYDNTGCESTFLGQMYADIWLDFTAPVSGVASFSLCTEDVEFDSDMVIYSGSCGQLVQEACNGDGVDEFGEPCPLLTSRISDFPVNQGDHYFIRVGGFDSVSQVELGPGVLTITID